VSEGQGIWEEVKLAWVSVEFAMMTLTWYLRHFSQDYHNIMKMQTMEKKMLKVHVYFIALYLDLEGVVH
jgi:hypothetical protein